MTKYKPIIIKRIFMSMLTNPMFILIYGISFYELDVLCRIGRNKNSIFILIACMIFFLTYLTIFIVRAVKKPKAVLQQVIYRYEFYEKGIRILDSESHDIAFQEIKSFKVKKKYIYIVLNNKDIVILNNTDRTGEEIKSIKELFGNNVNYNGIYKAVWTYTAIIIIVFVTLFYSTKIYNNVIKLNGKLAWYIKDLEDKRSIEFEHDNIYKDGIDGIFTDINKKISLPEKLYISTSFSLDFNADGTVTSFDTFIYGKNNKGKLESYLISYNKSKSNKIKIYLNGYAKPDYNEDKRLDPLIKTMKVIPLKKTVASWSQNKYGISYYGKQSFGYNKTGIVYIDSNGNTKPTSNVYSEIIGYVVSIYVPGKESVYTPVRYILQQDLNNIKQAAPLKESNNKNTLNKTNNVDSFFSSNKVGYRLEVTAAAAGSRSYSLDQTSDGGNTWSTINEDPFSGELGVAAGISFLNKKLGFLCLSHSGGNYGELYRTEDGGLSYSKIDFEEVKVTLSGTKTYNPFDLPGMPYKKDGCLNILIGQGADGDYNGGSKALYQSKDEGKTWSYIKEITEK